MTIKIHVDELLNTLIHIDNPTEAVILLDAYRDYSKGHDINHITVTFTEEAVKVFGLPEIH